MIRRLLCSLAAAGVVALGVSSGSALAQQDDGELLRGNVRNEVDGDDGVTRVPVEGVELTVLDASGAEVGSVTSDADGQFELALPGPGDYTVQLDQDTLPDDVELRDEAQAELVVNVRPAERQILNYFLGESLRQTESRWDVLPQTIANGIKFGLIIAITAVGLSLIYGTTGLSNFGHGELVTLGAIVAWWMNQSVGLHILIAGPLGVLAAALAGFFVEKGIWHPLRRKGVGLTAMMIVSIGAGLTARYIYLYTFGGRSQAYRQYAVQTAVDIGPVSLTQRDMISMAICVLVLVGVALFLQRSRQGKAIRAVSDNPDLASATGINTDRVILLVWVSGGALAGLGGVLLGLDEQVRWNMGFTLLLLMFAAITVGGLGNPYGALVGSLLIGLTVELWTWVFPGAVELKTTGALITLIIVLLVRPQGLLGRKERIG
ncbi:MAG: branched-chain amino acid ABC transporter permease [Ilumatobacteraceae bacterium]